MLNFAKVRMVLVSFMIGMLASGMLYTASARTIKLVHQAPTNDPRHETMLEFAKMIEKRTNGDLKVRVFPKGTLGKDREVVEQVKGGFVELALNGEIIGNFYKKWDIISMPYMWKDQQHLRRFLASDIAKKWVKEMEAKAGIKILGFIERNPRILATKDRKVSSVGDLQGLKVRVPRIDVYMDTWRAFGVQPTPMSASEFFMALKMGTVDGMENPIEVMYHWKIYEVAKNLSMTNHMLTRLFITASSKFLNSISSEQKNIILQAAKDAEAIHAKKMEVMLIDLVGKLKEKGMEIVEHPDLDGFKIKAKTVHEKYMGIIGKDVYDAVLKMRN